MKNHLNKLLSFFLILSVAVSLQAEETVTISRVVDGDTFLVINKGEEESVRLIGIDTLETKAGKKGKSDAKRSGEDLGTIISQGREALKFVKTLVKLGDTVTIEFDIQTRDKYEDRWGICISLMEG
jgi:endonuclease YncB( thermonuclease family)